MAPNTKRVFYVNALSHDVYLEILAKRPDVQIDKLVNDSPEDAAESILANAHATSAISRAPIREPLRPPASRRSR